LHPAIRAAPQIRVAFLSANAYFKHPDVFRGVIAMSGSYAVRSYLKGHYDDNVYFNNPVDYLPNLNDVFSHSRELDTRTIVAWYY
jgi:esterase/lipase superfamily enzyme